jgi:hypothetical protein
VRFDVRTDLGHGGLRPRSLVVVTVGRSVQAEQQGDMWIRQGLVEKRPGLEQLGDALQCPPVKDVHGARSTPTTASCTPSSGCCVNIWMRFI